MKNSLKKLFSYQHLKKKNFFPPKSRATQHENLFKNNKQRINLVDADRKPLKNCNFCFYLFVVTPDVSDLGKDDGIQTSAYFPRKSFPDDISQF